jgi:hypothetical protein
LSSIFSNGITELFVTLFKRIGFFGSRGYFGEFYSSKLISKLEGRRTGCNNCFGGDSRLDL